MILTKNNVDLLIIGAGHGGTAMLQAFSRCAWMNICCVVDRDVKASGIILAKTMGIKTSRDLASSICHFYGDLIVDATGNQSTYSKISMLRAHNRIEIISGKATRLLYDLANHQLNDQSMIDNQTLRLQLLNSMLDISLNLEKKSMHQIDVYTAHKAMAIMIEKGQCTIAGMMGDQSQSLNKNLTETLRAAFPNNYLQQQFPNKKLFIELEQGFHIQGLKDDYSLAIPLHRESDDQLLGILLFHHQYPLSKNQIKMINIIVKHLYLSIKTLFYYQSLEYHAIRDPLTDIYNRRYFEKRLKEELSRLKRQDDMVTFCLFFDLDHFKQINDHYGHQAGDIALTMVANCVSKILRDYDIFARYGGDEFVAVLPMKKQFKNSIHTVAKRILVGVKALRVEKYPEIRIETSLGIACIYPHEKLDNHDAIERADQALYKAKDSGRGCAFILDSDHITIISS